MATPGFYGGGFWPGGFFPGIPDPGDPPDPPPVPPPDPPAPSAVRDDVHLVYHADSDSLELIDEWSPKPRRGASYRGRRRRF